MMGSYYTAWLMAGEQPRSQELQSSRTNGREVIMGHAQYRILFSSF
jgi:hypothetical protein